MAVSNVSGRPVDFKGTLVFTGAIRNTLSRTIADLTRLAQYDANHPNEVLLTPEDIERMEALQTNLMFALSRRREF